MERFGVDEAEAFQMLVESSQSTNLKLVEVARWLLGEVARRGAGASPRTPRARRLVGRAVPDRAASCTSTAEAACRSGAPGGGRRWPGRRSAPTVAGSPPGTASSARRVSVEPARRPSRRQGAVAALVFSFVCDRKGAGALAAVITEPGRLSAQSRQRYAEPPSDRTWTTKHAAGLRTRPPLVGDPRRPWTTVLAVAGRLRRSRRGRDHRRTATTTSARISGLPWRLQGQLHEAARCVSPSVPADEGALAGDRGGGPAS